MIHLIKHRSLRKIPEPSLLRLCKLYHFLTDEHKKGTTSISSKDIGRRLGVGSHNIRKDINYLGEAGKSGAGYNVKHLSSLIEHSLGLTKHRNSCLIGMGALGMVLLNYLDQAFPGLSIVAGFDSNINRIETIHASIPLFPAYEIADVARRMNIELAVITEADSNIGKIIERCRAGGVRGILNLTPAILNDDETGIYVRNVDIVSECGFLLALFTLNERHNASSSGAL